MTKSQIINLFPEYNAMDTCLHDLDDSEFVTGGRATDVVREAGYDESGRKCVNDQKAWGMTIMEWAETMAAV
jgi:hypothetical protein